MEDLVTVVKNKTGLTEEQSRAAVQAVTEQLKKKFPQVLHTELDKVIAGGEFGDATREKFEGLKEKMEEAAKNIGQKAEVLAAEVKEKLNELFGTKKS